MVTGIEAVAQISATSRLRTSLGDGRLSAQTLEAIKNGAIPPEIADLSEDNLQASENARPTDLSGQSLREVAKRSEPVSLTEPQDVVALSPEGRQALNTVAAEPTQEQREAVVVTSQNQAEQRNPDTATTALGNTVDVES